MTDVTHEVVLRFEDGIERTLRTTNTEPILTQALSQGIPLVHQCRSGSCGTCEAHLVDGIVYMSSNNAMALTPADVAAGARLMCSSFAQDRAVLLLPYSSELLYGPGVHQWTGVVDELTLVSRSVARLRIKLQQEVMPSFRSGQYARICIPGSDTWRSYSMASTEEDLPLVDFLVRLLDGGAMSQYLRNYCRPGDHIHMEGPLGSFYMRENGSHLIMLAGGTGLAPILSILDKVRSSRRPPPSVLLCFGCDTEEDLFYIDELELREFWMPSLELRVACQRALPSWKGAVGTPLSLLRDEDFPEPDTIAYVCGPPGMIDAARRQLSSIAPAVQMFSEQFQPSSA